MAAPLEVFARLSVISEGGEEISVDADGRIVTVYLPSVRAARLIVKGQYADRRKREAALDKLHQSLRFSDLDLEFRVGRRLVGRLGPLSRPTFWSRLLGYGSLELKIIPILISLLAGRRIHRGRPG